MIGPSLAISSEAKRVSIPAISYSSWADEVGAVDLEAGDKPAKDESDDESANEDSAENSINEELAGDMSEISESEMNESENPTDED